MNAKRVVFLVVAAWAGAAQADVFNMGPGLTSLEMVTVGNPGNALDVHPANNHPDGFGAVDHTYNIGKYEVTAGQYTACLNAVAKTDTHGLYNPSMWTSALGCKIQQSGTSGSYTYSVAPDYANRPVNWVSFWDAARFANWLQSGDTESGAYHDIGNQSLFGRNPGAKFFVPTENEWYKAAYHKNDGVTGNYWDFPTGWNYPTPSRDMTESTNSGNNANYYGFNFAGYPIDPPYYTTLAGEFQLSASPYGTFDQGGNVYEFNETANAYVFEEAPVGSLRGYRGGCFGDNAFPLLAYEPLYGGPAHETAGFGFRVASVPEPGSIILLVSGAIGLLAWAWQRRKRTAT